MTATTPTPLTADLKHGLRQLKLVSIRRIAPELLMMAKTQRWLPEKLHVRLIETGQ